MPDISHESPNHSVNTHGLSGNMLGALYMLMSGFLFTIFAVLAKQLSADHNPAYLAFWRAFIALVLSLPFLVGHGWRLLSTDKPGLLFGRSIFGTFGFLLSLFAISDAYGLPLSQFNAISFSRSLFVTILAAVALKEAVGGHRWGAVIVGFVGVLIMVLPAAEGGGAFIGTMLALGSAASLAGAIVLVKSLSATHKPIALLIWANILSTVFLSPALFLTPSNPSSSDWIFIGLMSLCAFGGQYCYIKAMSVGDASFLSPMDYLRLPMAAMADWLLFRLLPGFYVWIGAALIVISTLYIAIREARLRRKQPDTTHEAMEK